MSVYALNKLFYLLENDAPFRQRLQSNPREAIGQFPLTSKEKDLLLSGDVAGLFHLGVHPFLLNGLSRHQLFGVNRENYLERIRGQARPKRWRMPAPTGTRKSTAC